MKIRSKMCDHNDVTQLEMNMIQASDGFTRYKCKNCRDTIKKHVHNDIEFNRFYNRYHDLCVQHDTNVPTYKNSEGKTCCNWCGVTI